MKKAFKIILLLSLIIFPLEGVLSNGIQISPDDFEIEKTNGIDYIFKFNITSQENFTFYNISSQNTIISFDKINLESGETKEVTAKITENSNFNNTVKIIGDYFANLGASNETETVTIDLSGVDLCNLDLIEGDSIIWRNTMSGEVKLKNLDTNEYFATIGGGSEYEELFDSPKEFNYGVYKTGILIGSKICHLNIRPESGYVHSSEYDADLNLGLKITYEPTTVSTNFFTDSYVLNYNGEKDDSFRITNTGSKIAKNIKLSGDWFIFSDNNFDIPTGDYKTITYQVKPAIYETSQTNKTYNMSIKIEGNFQTLQKTFDVFINYRDLDLNFADLTYNEELMESIVLLYCENNKDKCSDVLAKFGLLSYSNNTERNVSLVANEDFLIELANSISTSSEDILDILGNMTERILYLEENQKETYNKTNETERYAKKQAEASETLSASVLVGLISFLFISIVGLISFFYFSNKGRISLRKIFSKGEMY